MSKRVDAHAALVDILNALDRVTNPERSVPYVALVTTRNGVWDDPTERAIASAVQKRDAEWRAAVERLKQDNLAPHMHPFSVLDRLVNAMEVK